MDIKEQKLNWLFNGHPQECLGICERYQQAIDKISGGENRLEYSKQILQKARQQIIKWKNICKNQQILMENSIAEFTKNEDNNIWTDKGIYVFNGFKFLPNSSEFYGLKPKYTKQQEKDFENAEEVLSQINDFVVILCQLRNWCMLYDYIKLDKNKNPVSAKQYQNEYKMLYSRIPFIKGEYALIYKSIYKNIDKYIENLTPFAVREFERSANGEVITKNVKKSQEINR